MSEEYKNLVKLDQLATFKRLNDETYASKNDMNSYYTKDESDEKFLTAHQSLDAYQKTTAADNKYATKTEDEKKLEITSFNDYSGKVNTEIATKVPYSAMTAYQPIGNYASSTDLTYVSGIVDGKVANTTYETFTASLPTSYFTKESADTLYQPTGNYLIPNDITGKQDKSAMTAYQPSGDYATMDDLNNLLTSTSGLAKYLTSYQAISGMTAYAKIEDLPETYFTKESADTLYQGKGNYVSSSDMSAYYTTAQADEKFLTAHQSLEAYQTIEGMTAYQPTGNYLVPNDITGKQDKSDMSGYYTKEESNNKFLTAHQSLDAYQTIEGMTAYQPTGDYATNTEVNKKLYNSAFETFTASLPTTYFTKESADTLYQAKGDYLVANDITGKQDKSEMTAYALESEMSAANDKISAIQSVIHSDDETLDTIQEIVDFAKNNKDLIDGILTNKQDKSAMSDYQTTAGMTAYAKTGDIPKDLFTKASADTLYQPIGNYVSSTEMTSYYTKTQVDEGFISTADISLATDEQVSALFGK